MRRKGIAFYDDWCLVYVRDLGKRVADDCFFVILGYLHCFCLNHLLKLVILILLDSICGGAALWCFQWTWGREMLSKKGGIFLY